jgi:hypothetical protein
MQTSAGLATNTRVLRILNVTLRVYALLALIAGSWGCAQPNAAPAGHLTHVWGQLLDSGGRPVSQYPMKLEPVAASLPSFSAVTNYSGDFEFADVPKGRYRVYPANRPSELGRIVKVGEGASEFIDKIPFGESVKVDLNAAAAPVINDQARQTINPEAARTINAEAAKTINPDAARVINPAAARMINPDAARVLNAERAKVLTPEQAQSITVQQAQQPLQQK